MDAWERRAVVMPSRRLSPLRLEITSYPDFSNTEAIRLAVLVLPLVPVTRTTGPLIFSFFRDSGSIFSPISPGRDPPLPASFKSEDESLTAAMDKRLIINLSVYLYISLPESWFRQTTIISNEGKFERFPHSASIISVFSLQSEQAENPARISQGIC